MEEKKQGGQHTFDSQNWQRLESPQRRELMNPILLAEAMELDGSEVLLDLGCGTGFFAEELAKQCGKLIGVDISDAMLAVFRDKESFAKLKNVELKVGSADEIPLPSATCDVVAHICLFHEIKDTAKFHQEIKRVLKPEGRLFCVDWQAKPTQIGPPVSHRVAQEKAIELLMQDGFIDIKTLDVYKDLYVIEARL